MPDRALNAQAVAAIAIATLLASCASQPDPLSSVRARMDAARMDENIRTHAQGSLGDAQRTLALAAEANEDDLRDHLIYLTERNLDIAGAVAERRRAETELDALRSRRAESREAAPPRTAAPKPIETVPLDDNAGRRREAPVTSIRPSEPGPGEAAAERGAVVSADRKGSSGATILTIPSLSFDSGATDLAPEARQGLDELVASLRKDPELRVLAEGHSDSSGTREQNLQMSLSRAKSVKAYLLERGIASHRVQTLGQGAKYPIANNATEEGRWRNRRVEIALYRAPNRPNEDARRP